MYASDALDLMISKVFPFNLASYLLEFVNFLRLSLGEVAVTLESNYRALRADERVQEFFALHEDLNEDMIGLWLGLGQVYQLLEGLDDGSADGRCFAFLLHIP